MGIQGEVTVDDPRAGDIRGLLRDHLDFATSNSRPEDVHALQVEGLLDPAVTLYSFRRKGRLLAIGALKGLDAEHAELKSMHTLASVRGQGVGMAMVEHLIAEAPTRGFHCLSLETGTGKAFAPARRLYIRAGFVPCPPFAAYRASPNSMCMTMTLAA